jgi:hypothetical protein
LHGFTSFLSVSGITNQQLSQLVECLFAGAGRIV